MNNKYICITQFIKISKEEKVKLSEEEFSLENLFKDYFVVNDDYVIKSGIENSEDFLCDTKAYVFRPNIDKIMEDIEKLQTPVDNSFELCIGNTLVYVPKNKYDTKKHLNVCVSKPRELYFKEYTQELKELLFDKQEINSNVYYKLSKEQLCKLNFNGDDPNNIYYMELCED